MFHLLNLVKEDDANVLLTTAPTALTLWAVRLPDLASRLRALPVVELAAPDDALLRAVLVKLFVDRQLSVDEKARSAIWWLASNAHSPPHAPLSRCSMVRRCASEGR